MTARPRPTAGPVPHAYAAEYQRATGRVLGVAWRDPARQWVAAGAGSYVEWLEMELKRARAELAEWSAGWMRSTGRGV